jgi:hypothetical protein
MQKNNSRRRPPMGVLRLEDRTVPASTITITAGANGTGSLDAFLFDSTPGTIGTTDGGNVPGTLSTGALMAVSAGTTILVVAQSGIAFNDLGGTLALQTGLGNGVIFHAGSGPLTVANSSNTLATGGGSFSATAGNNLTLFNLNTNGGDVTLLAGLSAAGNLAVGSILTAGAGTINLQAINPLGGTITQSGTATGVGMSVVATGHIAVDGLRGTTIGVTSNSGSISSLTADGIQSTGQLTLTAVAGINVNTLAPTVQATNTGSGNVSITQVAVPAQPLATTGTGVRNQAASGSVAVTNLGSLVTVAAGSPVQTNNGPITIAGQDLSLSGTVNSGTARATLANSTAGRPIDLGTNTAGQVGLTQGELNNVTAGVLQVGNAAAGAITISAAITAPAGWAALTLAGGSGISENLTPGTLTVANLRISGGGSAGVTLGNSNRIGVLAGKLSGPSNINNATSLTVGIVDGDTGITAENKLVLQAGNLDIQQSIDVGSQTLTALTFGQLNLGGSDATGVLGLTDAELGRIRAGFLDLEAGAATISSAITRHSGYAAMGISSGGAVTQTAPLSVAALDVSGLSSITLTNAGNDVDTLAGGSTVPVGFSFTDANSFALGNVGSHQGISLMGTVSLRSGGAVTDGNGAARNVAAGALTVTAVSGIDLDLDVGQLSVNLTANGPVTLSTKGPTLIGGPNVTGGLSAGTGTITLDGGTFTLSGNNLIATTSGLNLAGATLDLGAFSQSLASVRLTDGSMTGTGTLTSATAFDFRNGSVGPSLHNFVEVIKSTPGTVTLSGANDVFTTTVNGGTLVINGSQLGVANATTVNGGTLLVNGTVMPGSVVNGGTLGGSGTLGGLTASGGTVAPGTTGPGLLTSGNLSLGIFAAFAADLNGPTAGTQYDRLKVNGTVSLGTAALNLGVGVGFAPPAGTQFVVIDNDGTDAVTGTFAGLPEGATVTADGQSFSISYKGGTGNDVVLTRTATQPLAVSSVVVNAGQANLAQRSSVTNVTVTFSRLVNFAGPVADAFQSARTGPGTPSGNVTLAADVSGSTATQTNAKLTFSGPLTEGPNSLVDGDYTLTVLNNQIQGGILGGDYVTSLYRYYGDVNGDRTVNGLDLALFRSAFGTALGNANYVDYLDQNGDGAINGLDLAIFRTHFGTALP